MKKLFCSDCKTIIDKLDEDTYVKYQGLIADKQYMVDNSSTICPECLKTTVKDKIHLNKLYETMRDKYKYV